MQDIFLLHKSHFAVDLGEFGLTIRTEIFVTKTFYDLIVSIVAAHHQQLLECLRRLGKGIELPRIHARGDHEITCTFGRRFDQEGRLNIKKAMLV